MRLRRQLSRRERVIMYGITAGITGVVLFAAVAKAAAGLAHINQRIEENTRLIKQYVKSRARREQIVSFYESCREPAIEGGPSAPVSVLFQQIQAAARATNVNIASIK